MSKLVYARVWPTSHIIKQSGSFPRKCGFQTDQSEATTFDARPLIGCVPPCPPNWSNRSHHFFFTSDWLVGYHSSNKTFLVMHSATIMLIQSQFSSTLCAIMTSLFYLYNRALHWTTRGFADRKFVIFRQRCVRFTAIFRFLSLSIIIILCV